MFWKLVWRGHADDRHDRLCPWLRLLLRTHCISDALCSRGCDRLSACEHLRHMQRLRNMRRWRRDLVLRAAAELAALQGISADLRSRLLNLCDGLLCARLLRACSGLRIVWLRKLRLFERRLLKLRLRGGWLFDLRQWMLDVRLRASGMFKLRRLCIGHMRALPWRRRRARFIPPRRPLLRH